MPQNSKLQIYIFFLFCKLSIKVQYKWKSDNIKVFLTILDLNHRKSMTPEILKNNENKQILTKKVKNPIKKCSHQ